MSKPLTHSEFSSKGGKSSAKRLTAKQRKERARKAVMTRWAKAKGKK